MHGRRRVESARAIGRRVAATMRVWQPGGAHMAVLEAAEGRTPPGGFVDQPAAGSMLPRRPFGITGWALFPSGAPAKVELWLGDQYLGPARLGRPRVDVEAAHGMTSGRVAGFEHVVDLAKWPGPHGEATLRARATGTSGETFDLAPVKLRVARHAPSTEFERRRGPAPVPAQAAEPVARLHPERTAGALRVLTFTHLLDFGGGQLILLDLLRRMRETAGIECTVVCPLDGPLREPLEQLGFTVHLTGRLPTHDSKLYAGRIEELAGWAAGRFDAMLVNTVIAFPGGDLAQRLGIPAVWAIHESYEPPVLWWMQGASLHPEVRRRADAALWNAASAFFEAEATRRQYADHVPPGRSLTLPFGIDLEEIDAARARFDRAAARRVRKVPEHAKVVLCVGTVEPRKAQVPLVQAFGLIADRHPDARLVFVGGRDDADTLALREYVAACGPRERVTVVPIIPEVWPWYGLADLVVCASDVESLPRSVLESMAFETPVLATSVFGLPELIEHGETGWLCPPRDVRALADALDRALRTSDAERRRIGAAARELVRRRHALGPYAAGVTELLSQAVAGESAPVAGVRAE